MDCKYLSRVFLKGGTGNRRKTVRALTPTPGLVDVSRFRTGGVRVTFFFVAEERTRGTIVGASRGEERDSSARFLGRKGICERDLR